MRFTLHLDTLFDFLTPFSASSCSSFISIYRYQPILPLQKSRGPKWWFFLTFCGVFFFDVGKWLWRWFCTHIRFSDWRPDKTQPTDSIWRPTYLFLTVFFFGGGLFKGTSRKRLGIYAGKICKKKAISLFFRAFDVGNLLQKRFWTHIRFSDRRADEIRVKNNIWCPIDLFFDRFLGFWWAFRADLEKSKQKYEKKS